MSAAFQLGQLRHLYAQMLDGRVQDTREAARGLLGPVIEQLELAEVERDRLRGLLAEIEEDAMLSSSVRDRARAALGRDAAGLPNTHAERDRLRAQVEELEEASLCGSCAVGHVVEARDATIAEQARRIEDLALKISEMERAGTTDPRGAEWEAELSDIARRDRTAQLEQALRETGRLAREGSRLDIIRVADAALEQAAPGESSSHGDQSAPGVCDKQCDHGSPCLLLVGHSPGHETQHGCVFYDEQAAPGEGGGVMAACVHCGLTCRCPTPTVPEQRDPAVVGIVEEAIREGDAAQHPTLHDWVRAVAIHAVEATLKLAEERGRTGVRAPIPMLLWCPECGERHLDEGEFATKPHHTHACQECGMVWRPAVEPTCGVQFLPGFKNGAAPPPVQVAIEENQECERLALEAKDVWSDSTASERRGAEEALDYAAALLRQRRIVDLGGRS